MNNLFSSSWRRDAGGDSSVEMSRNHSFGISATTAGGANLDKFFEDVEAIKDDLKQVESLHKSLHDSNESSKTLHNAAAVHNLRSRMDSDVSAALKKAKLIKIRLESLDRANAANRSVPGCGPGSSTDRTRTSVVAGLRKKLKSYMEDFQELRKQVQQEYKETISRRYFTVTGQKPEDETVDKLIQSGEAEMFMQRAIEEQGRGNVVDVIAEIQERHGAVREIERGLLELQQVFMDMAVLVAAQGEQLDDIESQVGKARSFVQRGTTELVTARKHQRNTRKWTCFAIILLIVIVLIIVLPIVLSSSKK